MEKDNLVYLRHISESINLILEYTKDTDKESFIGNRMMSDAVIRNFQIIGEATKKITEDFRAKNQQIEWRKMSGMRDKLIHDYIGVDLPAVWNVIVKIIPDLKR